MLSLIRLRHRSGRRGKVNRYIRNTVLGVFVIFVVLFIIVPIVFRNLPGLQRHFLFRNTDGNDIDLTKPAELGLPGTRNFYLETDEDGAVGVWHILPENLIHSVPKMQLEEEARWFEGTIEYNQHIILYMHGNKASRGDARRVEFYTILRKLGYHVFTFDYRGFADSSNTVINERVLVKDAEVIFRYLLNRIGSSQIIVWGHSLGTGVACHAVGQLCLESLCPGGLVLEAPFNNMADEVRLHRLSTMFRWLPYYEWAFISPLKENDVQFKSDEHIRLIKSPILILHAEDDTIIPFELGKKLQIAGQKNRSPDLPSIKLIKFDKKYEYGHNFILRSPELTSIIRDFIKDAEKFSLTRKDT